MGYNYYRSAETKRFQPGVNLRRPHLGLGVEPRRDDRSEEPHADAALRLHPRGVGGPGGVRHSGAEALVAAGQGHLQTRVARGAVEEALLGVTAHQVEI